MATPSIPVLVEQHAEEAASNWTIRRLAVRAPHFDVRSLADLDGRIEAHLDGLRVAGEDGWAVAEAALGIGDAGDLFVATVLALESADPARLRTVISALQVSDELRPGFLSAFGWVPWETARPPATELLRATDPALRAAGLRAFAVCRRHPGPALEAALRAQQPAVAAAAARAAGELGRRELVQLLEWQLGGSPEVKAWAAWSGALLGSRLAASHLAALAPHAGARADGFVATAARTLDPAARKEWSAQLGRAPETRRLELVAMGVAGDPAAVPALVEAMDDDEVARVAGEAFSLLTGADLDEEDLDRDAPPAFDDGPSDDPEDEDVALPADAELPWPDAALVHNWWGSRAQAFIAGRRYLGGKPISREGVLAVLRLGRQRLRLAAAEELKLLAPEAPLLECRARGGGSST